MAGEYVTPVSQKHCRRGPCFRPQNVGHWCGPTSVPKTCVFETYKTASSRCDWPARHLPEAELDRGSSPSIIASGDGSAIEGDCGAPPAGGAKRRRNWIG